MSNPPLIHAARLAGGTLLLALLYFAAGRLSLALAIPPGYATAVWPGAGIALAALLLYGNRWWPGVVLGSFLVNVSVTWDAGSATPLAQTVAVAFAIGIGAGGQALLGSVVVRRFIQRDPRLFELRNMVGTLLLGGPVSCLLNASWGTGVLLAGGLIQAAELGFTWTTWWLGDSIGVLIFVPLALIWLGKPRRVLGKRKWVITAPLVLTFAAVVFAFGFASRQQQKAVEFEFLKSGELIADALETHIVQYLEVVHGIQSYFASTGQVSRSQFQTFVNRTLERVPGIHALSWNPRVSAAERADYEAAARRDGLAGFQITERDARGDLVAAGHRPEYVIIYYIEPHALNRDALGYDVYSQPTRHEALDLARDSGGPVATGRVDLVQETGSQSGVLVFVPIYQSGIVPASVAERRAALLGYAVGVFRLGDVLTAALEHIGITHLEARLYDDSAAAEDPSPLAVYHLDWGGRGQVGPAASEHAQETGLTYARQFDMAGRAWRLELIPDRHYLATHRSWTASLVPAGGLLFISLLELFLFALTGRGIVDERRAQELEEANASLNEEVAQRIRAEQALFAEKERAEVTLHSIGDAVITTNSAGDVEYLNPVAEQLTGWSAAEAIAQPLPRVFRILDEETREPALDPVQRCQREGRVVGLTNHTVLISRAGHEYAIEDSAAPIRDHRGQVLGVVLVFKDVTEARRLAREAAHYATHDPLTGLVNRREFDRRLDHALASSKQYNTQHALCYLDLDQFKIVNDTSGHGAGDELLKRMARLLASEVRERDTLARLGGDEFGLLLDNCPLEKAVEIAENLAATVRDSGFAWDERHFEIGVSIGLVPIAGQVETAEVLLSHADVACYAAKNRGRNRVHVYRADTSGADPNHREILRVADMRNAMSENRFCLYQQPIWSLRADPPRIVRHELLLRMFDEKGDVVMPGSFVPVAERFGLMERIDRWVVATAFQQYESLFPDTGNPSIAINLSGNALGDEGLLDFLREQFSIHDVNPEAVCFEITETAAIRNITAATDLICSVRDMGGKFALDDFGSGLSSFAYLKNLPVDYLKIDGNLVRPVADESRNRAIVESIIQLAHRLGVQTVAEYVETPRCVEILRDIAVDYAQGFALARPSALPRDMGVAAFG